MKNISLALNGVLIVAVAILYYMQFSNNCCSSSEVETKTVIQTDSLVVEEVDPIESNIAYISVDSLQTHYKLYSELINKLKVREKKYEKELNAKMVALESKFKDFQQKAPTMSQFEGQTKQKELMEEEQKIYKMRDDFAAKFQNEEAKLNEQFQAKVRGFIEEYNKDKGYNLIIGSSQLGNVVLYKNEGIDISNAIINGLNEQYDNENSAKNAPKETK
ncbi:MAG: OmpH family outer membrane protein [Vicingaceae bacterium]|nr:OmpH family outer membrane protein [Vicingaceae bacterium]